MNIEALRSYCLSLPSVTESFPFGPDALVFMIDKKMFALVNLRDERLRVNLKCDPDYAIELRDEYEEIIPGWHMNKKHWNTVYLDGSLKTSFVQRLVQHSYDLVTPVSKKTKS